MNFAAMAAKGWCTGVPKEAIESSAKIKLREVPFGEILFYLHLLFFDYLLPSQFVFFFAFVLILLHYRAHPDTRTSAFFRLSHFCFSTICSIIFHFDFAQKYSIRYAERHVLLPLGDDGTLGILIVIDFQ